MKNFPNTKSSIENNSIIDDVENILYAEWNMNRYITNPTIIVNDTIPTTAAQESVKQESDQIKEKFPIESVVRSNRGGLSSYIIEGTKYRTPPVYVNQAGRSETSWQEDTTWLWYGDDARYEYWVSSLMADKQGTLPHNTGNIKYTWSGGKNVNKIRIQFQKDNAFPVNWEIYVDTTGDQNWRLISSNQAVPSDGEFVIYRDTINSIVQAGDWIETPTRWTPEFDNHLHCHGIKIIISSIDIPYGRPAIIEIAPSLDANITSLLKSWNTSEELSDSDFINPMGTASANTGTIYLSNSTGLFNELDHDSMFYRIMDEEVLFTGYIKFGQDKIPMFKMLSDSWRTSNFDTAEVSLVDQARTLQNMECKDMLLSNITVGTGLHMMFASLGLKQFHLSEVSPKETPGVEKFYTMREQNPWEVITNVSKGLQLSAVFDSEGTLQVFSKEHTYDISSSIDYEFSSESGTDRVPDLVDLTKEENSRFNKVVIRFNPIDDFSRSGSKNQKLWSAPDTWTIGAAQIVKNIYAGDNYFTIDPNREEDLPRYSGIVLIQGVNGEFKWEGKRFHCKRAPTEDQYITVKKPSDFLHAVEKNLGEAPRFTGKVYLKDGETFKRDFTSKAYQFLTEWDVIQYQEGVTDGKRMVTGAKHQPVDGSLEVRTDYPGSRRLNISKFQKNWNRFDRVGIKFKTTSNSASAGVVIWPQGRQGASGYYFTVDPMSQKDINNTVLASGPAPNTVTSPPPEVHGFVIRGDGSRVNMQFDTSKDYRDVPPIKVDQWAYLEVAAYNIDGGFEFEVYVNGDYCKTFSDKTVKLERNERAGMTFMGIGKTLVDKFYVVNYPANTIKGKGDDNSGTIIRKKDLWSNRKSSSGDRAFNKYLKSLEKKNKTQVFESDFSGRYYAVAREKVKEHVRFEDGNAGILSKLVISNKSVDITRYEPSSFGANFTIVNRSEQSVVLKGSIKTDKTDGQRAESSYIYGKSYRRGDTQEIEYKKDSLIDRIGNLPIEFESEWIQDYDTANDLAKWVMDRFGESAEIYTITVFGNPLIEIGDIVTIEWPEKGLGGRISNTQTNIHDVNLGDEPEFAQTSAQVDIKWVVLNINRGWETGLITSVKVRRII